MYNDKFRTKKMKNETKQQQQHHHHQSHELFLMS